MPSFQAQMAPTQTPFRVIDHCGCNLRMLPRLAASLERPLRRNNGETSVPLPEILMLHRQFVAECRSVEAIAALLMVAPVPALARQISWAFVGGCVGRVL